MKIIDLDDQLYAVFDENDDPVMIVGAQSIAQMFEAYLNEDEDDDPFYSGEIYIDIDTSKRFST